MPNRMIGLFILMFMPGFICAQEDASAPPAQIIDLQNVNSVIGGYFADKNGKVLPMVNFSSSATKDNAAATLTIVAGRAPFLRLDIPQDAKYLLDWRLFVPKPGSEYMLTFNAKTEAGDSAVDLLYELKGSLHYYRNRSIELSDQWKKYECLVIIPKAGSVFNLPDKSHEFHVRFWNHQRLPVKPSVVCISDISFSYIGELLE